MARRANSTATPRVCRTGRSDIQLIACGVTPASHVNQNVKNMANAGRTLGAGLVAGVRLVGRMLQILKSGSEASVEVSKCDDASQSTPLGEFRGKALAVRWRPTDGAGDKLPQRKGRLVIC